MNADCTACQSAAKAPARAIGLCNFYCASCMARLIVNARPSKAMQERQIDALARFHKEAWPAMFEKVKEQLRSQK